MLILMTAWNVRYRCSDRTLHRLPYETEETETVTLTAARRNAVGGDRGTVSKEENLTNRQIIFPTHRINISSDISAEIFVQIC